MTDGMLRMYLSALSGVLRKRARTMVATGDFLPLRVIDHLKLAQELERFRP